jgi:hypothetical protein
MGTLDKIGRFANWFRGGTEAVKGRQLGRVLREVPETPAALPNPEDIASHRMNYLTQEQDAASANRMAAQARKPEGLGPTQRLEPVAQNPNPELLQRSARATERTAGIAKTQAANRAENLVRSLRTEELLSKARQQQAAARTLKEK